MSTSFASRARCAGFTCVLLSLALSYEDAAAIDFETLIMPGPVVEAHADAEKDCAKCHPRFRKIEQKALCLACHEEVALDLRQRRGFHGRHAPAANGDCRDCHTDHQGRNADITGLDPETFDHEATNYPLRGAHRTAACDSCHSQDKPRRDAASECIDCHREVDAHAGALGESCSDCHDEVKWGEARFDHDATQFALTGAHAKTDCALCHVGERYEGVPSECGSCHRLDDTHRGRLGSDCASCHETSAWTKTRFDHTAKADFALRGRHGQIACAACHTASRQSGDLPRDCIGCHRADDDHRGRFGGDCASCHSEASWKPARFDHGKTDFPLRGRHEQAGCEACHRGGLFEEELDDRCIACHGSKDVHRGQQGSDCSRCHDEAGWSVKVAFDHGLTKFPLLGLHAAVACEECHLSAAFKDVERRCAACHQQDDAHDRSLGSDCAGCHNPNGWSWWRFDHDTRTSFALHGGHADLECGSCHQTPTNGGVTLSESCHSCHSRDDAHAGRMGRRCDVCHGDSKWEDVKR